MTLHDYMGVLRRSWLLILIATILGTLLGVAASLATTPVYQATAQLFVSVKSAGEVGHGLLRRAVRPAAGQVVRRRRRQPRGARAGHRGTRPRHHLRRPGRAGHGETPKDTVLLNVVGHGHRPGAGRQDRQRHGRLVRAGDPAARGGLRRGHAAAERTARPGHGHQARTGPDVAHLPRTRSSTCRWASSWASGSGCPSRSCGTPSTPRSRPRRTSRRRPTPPRWASSPSTRRPRPSPLVDPARLAALRGVPDHPHEPAVRRRGQPAEDRRHHVLGAR